MKIWRPSGSSLFPYTTLFRSAWAWGAGSLGVGLDVGEEQGKTVHLRHERDRASGAAHAAQPYQLTVLGMATGWLVRRDASDGLDRLECLEHLRHVDAEPLAPGVSAGRAADVAAPLAESPA